MSTDQVVHVEVQDTTTGEWTSVGNNVQLLFKGTTRTCHQQQPNRLQLPRSVKALLAPSTNTTTTTTKTTANTGTNTTSTTTTSSNGGDATAAATTTTPRPLSRKDCYLFRHARNKDHSNTNLIIFLHGAGDTHRPFDKLGQTMALPHTATLSVSAQSGSDGSGYEELPFGLGFTWFQEMEYTTGMPLPNNHPLRIQSLRAATLKFTKVLDQLIQPDDDDDEEEEEGSRCGWISPERIFLFGYGSGATLVHQICRSWSSSTNHYEPATSLSSSSQRHRRLPLGGAICVCGGSTLKEEEEEEDPTMNEMTTCSSSCSEENKNKNHKTPILFMVGEQDTSFSPPMARLIQKIYGGGCEELVQIHVEPGKGQEMICRPREMECIMKFLAQRLVQATSIPTTTD
jgi:predicted esterase